MVDEVSEWYGRIDVPGAADRDARSRWRRRAARSWCIYEDGEALAGGGVKRLDDAACEIKRMYVIPEARGRGLGKLLLEALEAEARRWATRSPGWTRPEQPEAQGMYERAGYRAIENFNANPFASFWGEKRLQS